jgi:hypothetical protein
MSEWEAGPGLFWVLTALLAVAYPRSENQTDRPFRDSPRDRSAPANRPAHGSLRPGWPPGESPPAPPRPPGADGRPAFPLAA